MQYIFSHAFAIILAKNMWASDLTNKYLSDLAEQHKTAVTAGTTVENKGKLILTEIFPSVQKHDI